MADNYGIQLFKPYQLLFMNRDTRLNNLYIKHENQLKAFERHREDILKAALATEMEILQHNGYRYADAPAEIWRTINILREDYYQNWSNEGRLLNELMRRQKRDVQRILDMMR
jgi:vacuolar-type H+-ATPase catalytic subunit A/Vma1